MLQNKNRISEKSRSTRHHGKVLSRFVQILITYSNHDLWTPPVAHWSPIENHLLRVWRSVKMGLLSYQIVFTAFARSANTVLESPRKIYVSGIVWRQWLWFWGGDSSILYYVGYDSGLCLVLLCAVACVNWFIRFRFFPRMCYYKNFSELKLSLVVKSKFWTYI